MTIGRAAELTGLTADTLRYYERDGLMLQPVGRSSTGHRLYSESDLRLGPAGHPAAVDRHADP